MRLHKTKLLYSMLGTKMFVQIIHNKIWKKLQFERRERTYKIKCHIIITVKVLYKVTVIDIDCIIKSNISTEI